MTRDDKLLYCMMICAMVIIFVTGIVSSTFYGPRKGCVDQQVQP